MKTYSFTFLFAVITFVLTASQDPMILGKILDAEGAAVSYATVILNTSLDSTMVKANISDETGEYTFSDVPEGQYFVQVTYVGYADQNSDPFEFDGKGQMMVPTILLREMAEELAEVVVTSSRPIVEVHSDKTVFNVDGSVNAVGHTALELLRKSPGVVVDNNENLMLQGKNGVQVYIDGKKSPLSPQDLANYLKSLQSSEIDAIEIITNPSAKYEAEGNAGIINIRFKKDMSIGFNGSTNIGYRYGQNSKYNGSVSLNYRDSKFNTFGSVDVYTGDNRSDFFLYREQGGNAYDQINQDDQNSKRLGFRFGTDFFLNKEHTIGFLMDGNLNENTSFSSSHTEISGLTDMVIDSFLIAGNTIESSRDNVNFNVNYAFNTDEGESINVDLDYGLYRNESESFQPNRYVAADGMTTLQERTFSNITPTDIDIYTAKLDYEKSLWGGKLGLGTKLALVTTDNTFDNYDIIDDQYIKNDDRSNTFDYRENVNALYAMWQKKITDKMDFSMGLRMEHTSSKGELTSIQSSNDDLVERNYLDFFPSAGITYQSGDDHSWRVAYSRRIDRPSYQDLNPFEYQLDELTFQRGNPFLNPQYSNAVSISHTYKYTLNSSLSYTIINDVFTQITDAVDDRTATLTNVNLAKQTNLALTVSYPFAVAKWWNVYATATAYRLHNEADIDGKVIDLSANAFNFYGQNTFLLPKGFKAELSGWYNAPTLWGNWVTNSQYDVSVGVSKSLLHDAATIKLTFSDIFYTNGWGGSSEFGDLIMRGGGTWESRQIRLNFTYLFGNQQVKSARNRKTGLQEEKGRIKSDN